MNTPTPIKRSDFDFNVRPQDDFYHFVNGGWMKRNSIPKTESRWGSFDVLRHKTRRQLHALLRGLTADKRTKGGSDYAKLRDLFLSAMDMKTRTKLDLQPLEEGFALIDSLGSKKDLPRVLAWIHKRGVSAPWNLGVDQDEKESRRMVLRIGQGGIGVPDRNYHLKKDKESKRVRDAYQKHVGRILKLEKAHPPSEVARVVRIIFRVETALARASMTPVERRNIQAQYNKYTQVRFAREFPAFNWKEYFDALGIPQGARAHIIVNQPKFLKEVNRLFAEASVDVWKSYLRWHFLNAFLGMLGEDFVRANFEYARVISGAKKLPELWKRAVGVCDGLMGDALGRLYVEHYFPQSAKKDIEALVKNLTMAYRLRIKRLDWMSEATKRKAFRKLNAVSLQLGYPKKWQSYKRLEVDRETFAENVLRGIIFDFELDMQKLAKPTDRNEWYMTAPTVNAYYSPNLNQIVFPAGILQPPFFYPLADDAVNYGAIGAVIGHELTHAFDDNGAKFDEKGNLKNWWTKKDYDRFHQRGKILVKQFNKYHVVGGIHVNGKLTLGENIADLGGLVLAFDAFQRTPQAKSGKKNDGLTPNERFFISHAVSERMLVRPEFLKMATLIDEHAPNEFRSNGPVSNCDAFYDVFEVKRGDRLYRAPRERTRIW